MALLQIHPTDNVAVLLDPICSGETLTTSAIAVTATVDIEKGHKIALTTIGQGEPVVKYGFPIGTATAPIQAGDWVHTHNLATSLGEILDYEYKPAFHPLPAIPPRTFMGYRRADGKVGIRNEIWVIPTVSCVNRNAEVIARLATEQLKDAAAIDGIYEIKHPYGCSQMGEDHHTTQRMLANLVNHPNAAAVLILGLGCENNHIAEFKQVLGKYDTNRVRFLEAQAVEDEIETGVALICELAQVVSSDKRGACSAAELVVGLKCGGSDGFSGITANPLVGAFSDRLIAMGGSTVLTEVPEMFGAESILMNRAVNETVFKNIVHLINDFKQYFIAHNQPIYENPAPGNKKGGISTLEEKSLGCTQKGGTSNVVDVLQYADIVKTKGLNLLSGPGNDAVAATALAAAGCQLLLFTTGRGTPLGTMAPTVKIATNSDLFQRKNSWMDFDAGRVLKAGELDNLANELLDFVMAVASGKQTKSEKLGFRDATIFKNGVTV
jgi:altronate hydrolase